MKRFLWIGLLISLLSLGCRLNDNRVRGSIGSLPPPSPEPTEEAYVPSLRGIGQSFGGLSVTLTPVAKLGNGSRLVNEGHSFYIEDSLANLTPSPLPIDLSDSTVNFDGSDLIVTPYPSLNKIVIARHSVSYLGVTRGDTEVYEINATDGSYLGTVSLSGGFSAIYAFGYNHDGSKYYIHGSKMASPMYQAIYSYDSDGSNEQMISSQTSEWFDHILIKEVGEYGLIYTISDSTASFIPTTYYSSFDGSFAYTVGTDSYLIPRYYSANHSANGDWFNYWASDLGSLQRRKYDNSVNNTIDVNVVAATNIGDNVYYFRQNGGSIEGDLYCYDHLTNTKTLLYETPPSQTSTTKIYTVADDPNRVFALVRHGVDSNRFKVFSNTCDGLSPTYYSYPFSDIQSTSTFLVSGDGHHIVFNAKFTDGSYSLNHLNTQTGVTTLYNELPSKHWVLDKPYTQFSEDNNKLMIALFQANDRLKLLMNFEKSTYSEVTTPVTTFSNDSKYAYIDDYPVNAYDLANLPNKVSLHVNLVSFKSTDLTSSRLTPDKRFFAIPREKSIEVYDLSDGSKFTIDQFHSPNQLLYDDFDFFRNAQGHNFIISKWQISGMNCYLKITSLEQKQDIKNLATGESPYQTWFHVTNSGNFIAYTKGADNSHNIYDINADTERFLFSGNYPKFIHQEGGSKIYWYDSNTDRIYRSDENGDNFETMISAIAIDSKKGFRVTPSKVLFLRSVGVDEYAASVNLDGSGMVSVGPNRVAYASGIYSSSANNLISSSPSGRFVYLYTNFTTGKNYLTSVLHDDTGTVSFFDPGPTQVGPRQFQLTPNYQKVVYLADEETGFSFDLYAVNLDGTSKVRLSSGSLGANQSVKIHAVSPLSDYVAYREPPSGSDCGDFTSELTTGARKSLQRKDSQNNCMVLSNVNFSEDGQNVYFLAFDKVDKIQRLYSYNRITDSYSELISNLDPTDWIASYKIFEGTGTLVYTSNHGEIEPTQSDLYLEDL